MERRRFYEEKEKYRIGGEKNILNENTEGVQPTQKSDSNRIYLIIIAQKVQIVSTKPVNYCGRITPSAFLLKEKGVCTKCRGSYWSMREE